MTTIIHFQEAVQRLRPRPTPAPAPAPTPTPQVPTPTTISVLLPEWLRDRRADGRRPRGVTAYGEKLGQFVGFAGDIAPTQITEALVEAYKTHLSGRGLEPATTRNLLTVLRSFLAWCVRKGHAPSNSALAVSHPHVEDPNPCPLASEELDLLLAALDTPQRSHQDTWRRNRRACYLMLYCGLRLSEVVGLERRDIDLERRMLTVRREIAKGGRARVLPIAEALAVELEHIRQYERHWRAVDQGEKRPGTELKFKSLAHYFERTLVRHGLDIHAHQLRATFATQLYISGADLATIQRLLGHTDPKTTIRYIGACTNKEQEAVERLRFGNQNTPATVV